MVLELHASIGSYCEITGMPEWTFEHWLISGGNFQFDKGLSGTVNLFVGVLLAHVFLVLKDFLERFLMRAVVQDANHLFLCPSFHQRFQAKFRL